MASGPLVFIHPAIEEGSANSPSSGHNKSEDVVLRRVGDAYFYWNAPTAPNQTKQQATASSTWDLSADHLLSTDWFSSPRGHSDPNLQKNSPSCFSTELTFNNCMCGSSANSSSAIGPTPCSPTPPSAGTTTMTPNDHWVLPWQSGQRTSHGLNNEEDFFNSRSFFADVGSMATTIVNNRGGFFPPPPAPMALPPSTLLTTNSFEGAPFLRQISGNTQTGVEVPSSITRRPGANGSSSTSTSAAGNRITSTNSLQAAVFPRREGTISPLNRRSSATEYGQHSFIGHGCAYKSLLLLLVLLLLLLMRACQTSPRAEQTINSHSLDDPHRTETQLLELRTTYEDILSWSESFDTLMRCFTSPDGAVGQKAFREFLRSEYSEENILFWLACEDLKQETKPEVVEEKARLIYEDYISILSPKEVSLDSRVREMINTNMTQPTPHTFDEAQLQIYTLMQRDSYPRFLNSRIYKDLLAMTKGDSS
ncbi:Regulator of G protein signaling 20 [Echinococcus multilocularis]|uniref:Regulator of G protein signaling 20 n=1 Tax=Echinococcus multilocularis TaxID=6211 RepID=A0A068YAT8_ECHMU|nr:Regulator of G protein signaling 20 [Echinococcus multilocularis]